MRVGFVQAILYPLFLYHAVSVSIDALSSLCDESLDWHPLVHVQWLLVGVGRVESLHLCCRRLAHRKETEMLGHLVKAREQGGAGPDGESADARRTKDDVKRNSGLEVNRLEGNRFSFL